MNDHDKEPKTAKISTKITCETKVETRNDQSKIRQEIKRKKQTNET